MAIEDRVYDARKHALEQAVLSFRSMKCPPGMHETAERFKFYLGLLLSRVTSYEVHISDTFKRDNPTEHRPTDVSVRGDGSMSVTIHDDEFVTLTFTAQDAEGNQASDNGPVTWVSDNPGVLNLVPSADGSAVNVGAAGPLGSANVTGTDANGIATPMEAFAVIAEDASQASVNVSDPQKIPTDGIPTPDNAS